MEWAATNDYRQGHRLIPTVDIAAIGDAVWAADSVTAQDASGSPVHLFCAQPVCRLIFLRENIESGALRSYVPHMRAK